MKAEENLKVGDKVYNVRRGGLVRYPIYVFDEVERLTKTRAILKSGVQLINEPSRTFQGEICFRIHGDRYDYYQLATDEAIKEHEKVQKIKKINDWFKSREFTYEEKELIFNTLNNEKTN